MKKILMTILSFLIAYITFKIYNHITYWKFFVAFIGGGIDAYIVSTMNKKD